VGKRKKPQGRSGADLIERAAGRTGLPHAALRQIVADVIEDIQADLRSAADVIGSASSDLGIAARTLALRLDYAKARVLRPGSG
jgi:hypothetical protein